MTRWEKEEAVAVPHDRYGEPIEDDDPQIERPHRCQRGWIDRNADNPVPCLVCRPHLAPENRTREEASR